MLQALIENLLHEAAPRRELWRYGISGDLPLICCEGRAQEAEPLLRQFCLLKSCGVDADLVYLSPEHGEYQQPLLRRIERLLAEYSLDRRQQPDRVHVLAQVPPPRGGDDRAGKARAHSPART